MQTIKSNDPTKYQGQIDIDPKTLKKFLVTIGIGADGKMYYITRDDKVFDPSKMMPSTSNRIDDGTIRTLSATTLSATTLCNEKYCEVPYRVGGAEFCCVIKRETNEYMGSCPKEQYP